MSPLRLAGLITALGFALITIRSYPIDWPAWRTGLICAKKLGLSWITGL